MMRQTKKAKAVLDAINYRTVATIDADGQPWNTPVADFHFDHDYQVDLLH